MTVKIKYFGFILLVIALLINCNPFEIDSSRGDLIIVIRNENVNENLMKPTSLAKVQCVVLRDTKTVYDQLISKTNDTFNFDINDLKPSDNYSIYMYGRLTSNEVVCRAYKSNISVSAGKATTVNIVWAAFFVNLYEPINYSKINNNSPEFTWSSVSTAGNYYLQVSSNENFSNLYINQDNLSTNKFSPSSQFPDGDWYWRVRAEDSRGYWGVWSNTYIFTIAKSLDSPSNVDATEGTSTSNVTISWSSVNSANYYQVYRSTSSSSSSASDISGWQSSTTYTDNSATPGQDYYYWVKAAKTNSGGSASDFSAANKGWRALSAPSSVSATDGTYSDRVRITCNSATGASYYHFYRNTSDNASGASPVSGWQSSTTYDDSSVTPGQTYYYWVKSAVNSSGYHESNFSSYNTGYATQDLSPPSNISASDGASTSNVTISWSSVNSANYYQVYRSTSYSSSSASGIGGWQSSTTYTDNSATPGQDYYYWVKAAKTNSGGSASDFSAANKGWRALSAPSSVSATDGTYSDRVRITCNSVTGASYYRFYRNTSANASGASPVSGWQSSTTYDDSSVTPGQTYYYWVKSAVNSSGYHESNFNSYNTGYASYNITLTAPNGNENWKIGTQHYIYWSSNLTDNIKIELYKNDSFLKTIASDTPNDSEYNWSISINLTPDDDYKIKISSITNADIYDYSNSYFTLLPNLTAPMLVSPPDEASTSLQPYLDWTNVTGASRYQWQISNTETVDSNGSFTNIRYSGSSSSSYFSFEAYNKTVTSDIYFWHVRAGDSSGNWSAWSTIWVFSAHP